MKENIKITKEEYEEVLLKLEGINKEKESAIKVYEYYFSNEEKISNNPIMDLIIILSRRNTVLDESIKLEKKKYLYSCKPLYIEKNEFEILVEKWVDDINIESSLLSNEPSFLEFKENILKIVQEKNANKLLINSINNILSEEKILLRKKKLYERKNKKRKILILKKKNN